MHACLVPILVPTCVRGCVCVRVCVSQEAQSLRLLSSSDNTSDDRTPPPSNGRAANAAKGAGDGGKGKGRQEEREPEEWDPNKEVGGWCLVGGAWCHCTWCGCGYPLLLHVMQCYGPASGASLSRLAHACAVCAMRPCSMP